MDKNRCVVQLADHFLVVQNRTSRMVIRDVKHVGGTFHFCSTEITAHVTFREEVKYDLWHKCMVCFRKFMFLFLLICIKCVNSVSALNKLEIFFRLSIKV